MKMMDHDFRRSALKKISVAALSGAAMVVLTAAAPWSSTVSRTAMGATVVGNPSAPVQLTEYFSYTCGHCGDYATNTAPIVKAQYVEPGKVKVEYRNLARDPYDLTAALLARCGRETAFYGNHQAIFAAQPKWIAKIQAATEATQKSWFDGTPAQRAKKIAVDSGLFALMRARGYTEPQLTACLSSEASMNQIMALSNHGRTVDHVRGTPSFFVNGTATSSAEWQVVKSALDAALKGA